MPRWLKRLLKAQCRVYHDKDFNPVTKRVREFPTDFVLVAECDTPSLEQAFEWTNHINHAWWENEGVVRHGPEARSTSSGDVVVLPDGRVYVCRTMGWSYVGKFQDAQHNPLLFTTGIGMMGDGIEELEQPRREQDAEVGGPPE